MMMVFVLGRSRCRTWISKNLCCRRIYRSTGRLLRINRNKLTDELYKEKYKVLQGILNKFLLSAERIDRVHKQFLKSSLSRSRLKSEKSFRHNFDNVSTQNLQICSLIPIQLRKKEK